jgi:flavin-dependent dehydrogenase
MRVGIIGCSINGAYLAYKLAKAGHEVTVFEEKSKPGGKPCSGLVSERIWDLIPRNEPLIENRINSVSVRFPKRRIEARFRPAMLAVNRHELDVYVTGLAATAGAKILLGHKAIKIITPKKSMKPHLVAECGGRTVVQEFDRIVGCDGANSFVRAHLNVPKPSFRIGILANQKNGKNTDVVDASPTEHGFKWKIPRGKTAEIGVVESPKQAKRLLGKIGRGKNVRSALIPEGLRLSNDKRFALCGDAAGLTKPWSGGGIIWGMTAADLLVDANLNVQKYNRALERHFGPKVFFSKLARTAVYLLGNKAPRLLPTTVSIDSDWLY